MIIVGVWHKLHRSVGWEWNLGFNFSISPNWTPHFFWKTRLEYGAILFPSGMPTSERASERCDSDGRRRTYGGPTDVRAQGCWIRIYVMRDVRRGKTMSPKKEHQCRLPACCFQSWWQLCLNLVYSIKLLISCESSKTLDFAQLYCITKSRHKREEKRITRSHLKSPEVTWSQLKSTEFTRDNHIQTWSDYLNVSPRSSYWLTVSPWWCNYFHQNPQQYFLLMPCLWIHPAAITSYVMVQAGDPQPE